MLSGLAEMLSGLAVVLSGRAEVLSDMDEVLSGRAEVSSDMAEVSSPQDRYRPVLTRRVVHQLFRRLRGDIAVNSEIRGRFPGQVGEMAVRRSGRPGGSSGRARQYPRVSAPP